MQHGPEESEADRRPAEVIQAFHSIWSMLSVVRGNGELLRDHLDEIADPSELWKDFFAAVEELQARLFEIASVVGTETDLDRRIPPPT